MSRASNSLLISDVTATPIKLKYSSSYSNDTILDSGIYAQSGLNGPVTITGSVPQRTLRYYSISNLFYSNYLTGSYQFTTSSANNSLQSTAASGTFENNNTLSSSADIRYFPTESNAKIKIINIPRSSYGEKTSRKSFSLASQDGTSYYLVDDGNGNINDTLNGNVHVGNIIYPQGFVIITNPNYYCVMDGGPFTFPKSYIFDITTTPKTFNPILDAQADCAPVDTTTLTLITGSGLLFPSSSQNNSGLVTLSETDPLTNIVGLYRNFYTVKSTYHASSDEQPINLQIVDCGITGLTSSFLNFSTGGELYNIQASRVGISNSNAINLFYDVTSSIGTLIPAADQNGNPVSPVTAQQLLNGVTINLPLGVAFAYAYNVGGVCDGVGAATSVSGVTTTTPTSTTTTTTTLAPTTTTSTTTSTTTEPTTTTSTTTSTTTEPTTTTSTTTTTTTAPTTTTTSTTTSTTTIPPNTFTVYLSTISRSQACGGIGSGATQKTVYTNNNDTDLNGAAANGSILYDSTLNMAITGYSYVSDQTNSYTINSGTGVVGNDSILC